MWPFFQTRKLKFNHLSQNHVAYLNSSSLDPESEFGGLLKERSYILCCLRWPQTSYEAQASFSSHDYLPASASQRLRF